VTRSSFHTEDLALKNSKHLTQMTQTAKLRKRLLVTLSPRPDMLLLTHNNETQQ